jgi:hypothetical protein
MKRQITLMGTIILGLLLTTAPAFAQHGHAGGGPPSGVGAGPGPGAGSGMGHDPSGALGPSSASNSAPGSQPETGRRSVNDLLTQNTKLASQISDLTGKDAQQACSGFKNLGQCVAAAHVSKNLGIDFSALKGKVTGSGAENLGQAVHDLNPNIDAKAETKKGQQQAHDDLKGSGS